MKHIYFNRWFSVSYHYMNMIRDNPDGETFKFFGTHPDPNHISLQACDYSEQEPVLHGTEYVDYAVDFCKRNKIDIFIPRLKMFEIAKEIHRFDEIGTKVMVCRDIELLESMMEKDKFYESLLGSEVVPIPDYHVVETVAEFKSAYEDLIHKGHKVCFKPTNSEGGMGFRIIDNHMNDLDNLYSWVSLSVPYEQVISTLSSVESFPKLMVMELLEEDEISIDCLADSEGNLIVAIPRRKAAGRIYVLEDTPELLEIANKVAERCRIPYAYNVQVKYNKGIPKLLEINPRMSGGLFITCLSGVNMPYLAVKAIMDIQIDKPAPKFGIKASYLELPILMEG